MEGMRIFTDEEIAASGLSGRELAEKDLKETLAALARHLFGPQTQTQTLFQFWPSLTPLTSENSNEGF